MWLKGDGWVTAPLDLTPSCEVTATRSRSRHLVTVKWPMGLGRTAQPLGSQTEDETHRDLAAPRGKAGGGDEGQGEVTARPNETERTQSCPVTWAGQECDSSTARKSGLQSQVQWRGRKVPCVHLRHRKTPSHVPHSLWASVSAPGSGLFSRPASQRGCARGRLGVRRKWRLSVGRAGVCGSVLLPSPQRLPRLLGPAPPFSSKGPETVRKPAIVRLQSIWGDTGLIV